jgi:hypothetical protein
MAKFKYLESRVTNQNFIHEEIRSRLNSRDVCNHADQNILSSRLLSKSVNIKIYCTIITSPVVLYGCETLSLMLRDGQRSTVFENTAVRKISGRNRMK